MFHNEAGKSCKAILLKHPPNLGEK